MTTRSRIPARAVAASVLLLVIALGAVPFAAAEPAETLQAGRSALFLPLIRGSGPLPDLVVTRLELMPSNPRAGRPAMAQLTIRNEGSASTGGTFWVDLYVNPIRLPEINRLWPDLSRVGAAWKVGPLGPGETRLLNTGFTGDPDRPTEPYANFTGFELAGEHRLYVLVDSFAPGRPNGAVAELDEGNNGFGPLVVTVD